MILRAVITQCSCSQETFVPRFSRVAHVDFSRAAPFVREGLVATDLCGRNKNFEICEGLPVRRMLVEKVKREE